MPLNLIVKEPFDGYGKGAKIAEAAAVTAALKDHPEKVLRIEAKEAPRPKSTPKA
jgi:hypothetical protein